MVHDLYSLTATGELHILKMLLYLFAGVVLYVFTLPPFLSPPPQMLLIYSSKFQFPNVSYTYHLALNSPTLYPATFFLQQSTPTSFINYTASNNSASKSQPHQFVRIHLRFWSVITCCSACLNTEPRKVNSSQALVICKERDLSSCSTRHAL